ncbi:MAG: UPF0158 family protein [Mariprofundus sp.]
MKINFNTIMDAFEFVSFGGMGEHEAYLDPESGRIYYQSEYDDAMDSEDVLPEDIDHSALIALPHKNDFDLGKHLVINFTCQYMPDKLEKVQEIFCSRGAYARFKDLLAREDMLQAWYGFEANEQQKALLEWCSENEIETSDIPVCKDIPCAETPAEQEKINYTAKTLNKQKKR